MVSKRHRIKQNNDVCNMRWRLFEEPAQLNSWRWRLQENVAPKTAIQPKCIVSERGDSRDFIKVSAAKGFSPSCCLPETARNQYRFSEKIMAGYPDELKKGREWRIFMLKNHGKIVIIHYPYIASVKTKPDPSFKSHKIRFGIRIRIEKYFHERTGRNS